MVQSLVCVCKKVLMPRLKVAHHSRRHNGIGCTYAALLVLHRDVSKLQVADRLAAISVQVSNTELTE